MNIVYMGTPEFARKPLTALAGSRHRVLAVLTGPDKPAGRGHRVLRTPVKVEAERLGLPVYTPVSLKSPGTAELLHSLDPELVVVVAFRVLPVSLLEIPSRGAINIHASLLPRYRGAAPIHWAIINGESTTGLTSFYLQREIDAGNIILQEATTIRPDDTYDTLSARLSELSGPFLLRTLDLIESGQHKPATQDAAAVTRAPKLTPEDGQIDFGLPAVQVVNFVRGLSSKPAASTTFRGRRIKILGATLAEADGVATVRPGTILPDRRGLLVQCGTGVVHCTRVVPEGRPEMDGLSFYNGFQPRSGELFGEPVTRVKEQR